MRKKQETASIRRATGFQSKGLESFRRRQAWALAEHLTHVSSAGILTTLTKCEQRTPTAAGGYTTGGALWWEQRWVKGTSSQARDKPSVAKGSDVVLCLT